MYRKRLTSKFGTNPQVDQYSNGSLRLIFARESIFTSDLPLVLTGAFDEFFDHTIRSKTYAWSITRLEIEESLQLQWVNRFFTVAVAGGRVSGLLAQYPV